MTGREKADQTAKKANCERGIQENRSKKAACELFVADSEPKVKAYEKLMETPAAEVKGMIEGWSEEWKQQGKPDIMNWGGHFQTATRPAPATVNLEYDYQLFMETIRYDKADLMLKSMTAFCDSQIHEFKIRVGLLKANILTRRFNDRIKTELDILSKRSAGVLKVLEQWKSETLASTQADFLEARVGLNDIYLIQRRAPIGRSIDTKLEHRSETAELAEQAIARAKFIDESPSYISANPSVALVDFGEYEKNLLSNYPMRTAVLNEQHKATRPTHMPQAARPPYGGR